MGRGRGKGKKSTLTNNDDPGSGEEEKLPAQKRRGRPQKPLVDEIDEEVEKFEEEDSENANKKRKRNKQEKEKGNLVKEDGGNATKSSTDASESVRSNGFRPNGSRRKSKPHRAAEAGVECK